MGFIFMYLNLVENCFSFFLKNIDRVYSRIIKDFMDEDVFVV